ncbi:MAG: hypothetical protein Hyperionvirus6_91 [Hyperionvirus sp.]|uniref:Uncharacterized protein n=1 Tax=Hyperionvirus sp. TaxID=2487770 RepID=A0A3G5A7Z7_9VIRU|nr:MAG: hypothetical protein Hyperionvirus6_91 [Hyperionvirus sp.]
MENGFTGPTRIRQTEQITKASMIRHIAGDLSKSKTVLTPSKFGKTIIIIYMPTFLF